MQKLLAKSALEDSDMNYDGVMGFAYLTLGTVLILVSLPEPHGWWDKYCIVIGGLDYLAAIYHFHRWVNTP